jgi:hypothetical protein
MSRKCHGGVCVLVLVLLAVCGCSSQKSVSRGTAAPAAAPLTDSALYAIGGEDPLNPEFVSAAGPSPQPARWLMAHGT